MYSRSSTKPSKDKYKENYLRCIIAEFAETKTNEEILKTTRENRYMIIKRAIATLTTDLSREKVRQNIVE